MRIEECELFRPNTVFVIGAAASFDGFPLGTDLKSVVARALQVNWQGRTQGGWQATDFHIYEAIRRSISDQSDHNTLYVAGRQIMNGVAFSSSIDNFLHLRRENPLIVKCGKAAIAKIILECENNCNSLKIATYGKTMNTRQFDKTWHQIFAEICFEGVEPVQLDDALS